MSTVLRAACEASYSFAADQCCALCLVLYPLSERGCVSGYGFLGRLRMLSAFSTRHGGRPLPSQFPPPPPPPLRSRKPPYYCESQPRTPLASALSLPVRRAVSVSLLSIAVMELETPYVDVPSLTSPLFCSLCLFLCGAVPFLPLPYVRAARERGARFFLCVKTSQARVGTVSLVVCSLCERACRAGRESERGKSDGDTRTGGEGSLQWRTLAGLGLPPGFGYVFTCF